MIGPSLGSGRRPRDQPGCCGEKRKLSPVHRSPEPIKPFGSPGHKCSQTHTNSPGPVTSAKMFTYQTYTPIYPASRSPTPTPAEQSSSVHGAGANKSQGIPSGISVGGNGASTTTSCLPGGDLARRWAPGHRQRHSRVFSYISTSFFIKAALSIVIDYKISGKAFDWYQASSSSHHHINYARHRKNTRY